MKNSFLLLCCISPLLMAAQAIDSTVLKKVDSLSQVARLLGRSNQYDKAFEIIAQAEKLALEKSGKISVAYGNACFHHCVLLYAAQKYPEAEKLFLECKEIREQTIGTENQNYGQILNNLGLVYWRMGNYEKSEAYYFKAISIWEKLSGKENLDYALSMSNLGLLYMAMGEYNKAETSFMNAGNIRAKILGTEHPDYATCLSNLAILYDKMGQYEKAEPYYLEAKNIREKTLGKSSALYANTVTNLATSYYYMGKYEQAEPLFLEAKSIFEKTLGKNHTTYAESLNSLAMLYNAMGNYQQAESLWLEVKDIWGKTLGKDHPYYAICLQNMGILYAAIGNYDKAELLLLEALSIQEKNLGKDNTNYAKCLATLGDAYIYMGKLTKAQLHLLEAKAIQEKALGKDPYYALITYDIGLTYLGMGNYKMAEQYLTEAKAIQETLLGKDAPAYEKSLYSLAETYNGLGDYERAGQLYLEVEEKQQMQLSSASRHLSEQEMNQYLQTFKERQSSIFSFAQLALGRKEADFNIARNCYDNTLFHKGFLLLASNRMQNLADAPTIEKINLLKSYRRRLAAEYAKPMSDRKGVVELETAANDFEKELARTVAEYGASVQQVRCQDVQQQLKPSEAAIEFVHYQFSNPRPTDSILYAALVLLPGGGQPQFIPLFEEKQLDKLLQPGNALKTDWVNQFYSNTSNNQKTLYELLWQPLEEALAEVQTVYFSPTGLLHRLNLGAIAMPPALRGQSTEGGVLADRFRLIELGSTRHLVAHSQQSAVGSLQSAVGERGVAVLFGGIKYDMDTMAIATANAGLEENTIASRSRGLDFASADSTLRGGTWNYLPWTNVEVKTVEGILTGAGISARLRKEYEATEEAFKNIGTNSPSPRILHLATHGFFFPDPGLPPAPSKGGGDVTLPPPLEGAGGRLFKISEHPMIRSGLLLAGGNHAWQTGFPAKPGMEDGILTAYEISQMNLKNTELVVLSACETGLGDIRGNEGVYGLQRAFKMAGAKYLIMSLWQVPDYQTQQLMSTFYRKWLNDKMTIPDAFRSAQQAMREKYVAPFLWAGFVLVE